MPSAVVAASLGSANEIVAAQGTGRQIRVVGWNIVGAGAVTGKWVGGSTDKTGTFLFAAGTSNVAPVIVAPNKGWFDCGDNAALNLTLNTTVAVNGVVVYEVVPSGS